MASSYHPQTPQECAIKIMATFGQPNYTKTKRQVQTSTHPKVLTGFHNNFFHASTLRLRWLLLSKLSLQARFSFQFHTVNNLDQPLFFIFYFWKVVGWPHVELWSNQGGELENFLWSLGWLHLDELKGVFGNCTKIMCSFGWQFLIGDIKKRKEIALAP